MIILTADNGKVMFAIPKQNIVNLNLKVESGELWVKHYENGVIKSLCVKESLEEVVEQYNAK